MPGPTATTAANSEMGQKLASEWYAFMNAPFVTLGFVVVVGVAVWVVSTWLKGNQIESLQGRLALRDDEIADYKRKLAGASPDEARARIDALESRLEELGKRQDDHAPRRLTPVERSIVTEAAKRFPARIYITHEASSPQGNSLSLGLIAAFRDARWDVITGIGIGAGNPPVCGTAISVGDPSRLSPSQRAIQAALTAVGIEHELRGNLRKEDQDKGIIAQILLTSRL